MEFVARFGVVPREVVGLRAGTGRAVSAARERRLREAGLIGVLPGFGDSGRLVLCTRRGLGAIGREELPVARFSAATLRHSAISARVGVRLERQGHQVLSEREIQSRERAEGRRVFSAERRSGRYHRPDLVILPVAVEHQVVPLVDCEDAERPRTREPGRLVAGGEERAPAEAEEMRLVLTEDASSWSVDRALARGRAGPSSPRTQGEIGPNTSASVLGCQGSSSSRTQGREGRGAHSVRDPIRTTEDTEMRSIPGAPRPIAIEVELTAKAPRRLEEILRAWRRAVARKQFDRVRYLCGARALPYVKRAALRAGTEGMIEVEPLQCGEGPFDLDIGPP